MQIEAGDYSLQDHIEKAKRNATYTTPQIQNEIINISGTVIKNDIINDVKKAVAFSIMADETADISGTEQLSIGIRFFDDEKKAIREEFLGFIELHAMDAVNIASAIDNFIQNEGLDGRSLLDKAMMVAQLWQGRSMECNRFYETNIHMLYFFTVLVIS